MLENTGRSNQNRKFQRNRQHTYRTHKTKKNKIKTQHNTTLVRQTGAYLRKIAPMASTEIAFCIYNLIIIIVSPDIHGYVYYMFFCKITSRNVF